MSQMVCSDLAQHRERMIDHGDKVSDKLAEGGKKQVKGIVHARRKQDKNKDYRVADRVDIAQPSHKLMGAGGGENDRSDCVDDNQNHLKARSLGHTRHCANARVQLDNRKTHIGPADNQADHHKDIGDIPNPGFGFIPDEWKEGRAPPQIPLSVIVDQSQDRSVSVSSAGHGRLHAGSDRLCSGVRVC